MDASRSTPFFGWRMVLLAFLAYNAAIGLTSGSFGTVLPTLQAELGASRGAVSGSFGLMLLVIGILAPLVGNVVRKVSLRLVMPFGSCLCAGGCLWLAYAQSLVEVMIAFSLLVGSGACLMGSIAAPTLIGRWFELGRGKALGLAMMPLLILVAPPVSAILLKAGGRELLFLSLSGVFAVLVPVLGLLIVNKPEDVGQTPRRDASAANAEARADVAAHSTREIIADPRFWLLSIAIGIMTAVSIVFLSQGAGIALERGFDLTTAATVVSAYGLGALFGALGFGWLIDRIGPRRSLAFCLMLQTIVWLLVYVSASVPAMLILALFIGAAGGAQGPFHAAAMTDLFGSASFSRAIGYSYVIKIPFFFFPAPLAGYMFDTYGGYGLTIIVCAGCLAFAVLLSIFLALAPHKGLDPALSRAG